jgi:hypothetical protein
MVSFSVNIIGHKITTLFLMNVWILSYFYLTISE